MDLGSGRVVGISVFRFGVAGQGVSYGTLGKGWWIMCSNVADIENIQVGGRLSYEGRNARLTVPEAPWKLSVKSPCLFLP